MKTEIISFSLGIILAIIGISLEVSSQNSYYTILGKFIVIVGVFILGYGGINYIISQQNINIQTLNQTQTQSQISNIISGNYVVINENGVEIIKYDLFLRNETKETLGEGRLFQFDPKKNEVSFDRIYLWNGEERGRLKKLEKDNIIIFSNKNCKIINTGEMYSAKLIKLNEKNGMIPGFGDNNGIWEVDYWTGLKCKILK